MLYRYFDILKKNAEWIAINHCILFKCLLCDTPSLDQLAMMNSEHWSANKLHIFVELVFYEPCASNKIGPWFGWDGFELINICCTDDGEVNGEKFCNKKVRVSLGGLTKWNTLGI